MGKVNKPISVARAEFISNLTNLINNSMLPPFVLEPIIKDMYSDIHLMTQRQYELDYKQYQEQLEKAESADCPDGNG